MFALGGRLARPSLVRVAVSCHSKKLSPSVALRYSTATPAENGEEMGALERLDTPPPAHPNIYKGDTTGRAFGPRLPNAPRYVTRMANGYLKTVALRKKDIPEAEARLFAMREAGIRGDFQTYQIMMKAYADVGELDKLWDMFEELKDVKVKLMRPAYTLMVDAMSCYHQEEKLLQLFKEMQNSEDKLCRPYVRTYNSLLYHFAQKGDRVRCEDFFEEMMARGIAPNARSFNTMMYLYAKEKDVDQVMQMVEDMKLSMLKPTSNSFNILIDLFARDDLDHPQKEEYVLELKRQKALYERQASFEEWHPNEKRQQFRPRYIKRKKRGKKGYF